MQNYTQQPSVSRVIPPSQKINKCVGIEDFKLNAACLN